MRSVYNLQYGYINSRGRGGHVRTVKVKRAVARELCTPGLWYFTFRMSNHSSLSKSCYESIVSTRNIKYLAKCKSMYLCGHAPLYFSTRDNLPGHLAICVHVHDYNNNIIIMCIGLVHDIFTRNIIVSV